MSEPVPSKPPRAERGRNRPGPLRRVSVLGVFGELLITAGVLVLLFLAWQVWWNDAIMAGAQAQAATEMSEGWTQHESAPRDPVAPAPTPIDYGEPIVASAPADSTAFAVLYAPRFGTNYRRTVAEGVGTGVLNSTRLGVGHYPGTQMPGAVGNFAIAAHRSAYGGGMHLINELQLGDALYVQTADGYYTYRFRDLEYVRPAAAEVLAPVPHFPGTAPVDRIITLTSCNPLYSTAERIIAYGVLEAWQPTSAGPPTALAPILAAQAQG